MTSDHCPACSRPLEDVGPLPAGSVRLCPCRLRPAFRGPDDPGPAQRLRVKLLRLLARRGPLPAYKLSAGCGCVNTAAVAALLHATPGVVRDGKTYRLQGAR